MYLSRRGYKVAVLDNYFRRRASTALNRDALLPILNLHRRCSLWESHSGRQVQVHIGDVCDYSYLLQIFQQFQLEVDIRKFADQGPDNQVNSGPRNLW